MKEWGQTKSYLRVYWFESIWLGSIHLEMVKDTKENGLMTIQKVKEHITVQMVGKSKGQWKNGKKQLSLQANFR